MRPAKWLQAFAVAAAWMLAGALLDADRPTGPGAPTAPDECAECFLREREK